MKRLFSALVLSIILFASPLWAAIYYVDTSGDNSDGSTWAKAYTTIQAGINDCGSGDSCYVYYGGTYQGAGNVNLDYGAAPNDFTVISVDYDGNAKFGAVVDGEGAVVRGIIFDDGQGNDSVFEGFVVTRCNVSYGAGMRVSACSPTVKKIWFKDNHSSDVGGGFFVFNAGANPIFEMVLLTGNSSDTTDGAFSIANSANGATLKNITCTNNSAATNYPGCAFYRAATVTNLISYGNVMAGMTDENVMTATTPTYSLYDFSNTAGDTPGAGCLDGGSVNPLLDSLFRPALATVNAGGVDAWTGTDQVDIYGMPIDVSVHVPMGAAIFPPSYGIGIGGDFFLGLDLGL